MKLVYINAQFLQHLHALDPHGVLYDQGKFIRPYIGPVLTVNGKNYYAPLSRDHSRSGYKAPNSQPTVVKLITVQGQYVGKLKLNNMLPVPESLLEIFSPEEFLELEPLYAQIVNKQRCAVDRNLLQIQKKAAKLYHYVVEVKEPFFVGFCAKFSQLELAYDDFVSKAS